MKRKICIFLTVLLALGCMSPAWAAEEDFTGLYEQYGPWHTWSQEQKDAAEESWTEEAWYQYWADYEAWAWLPMDQYYLDNDTWYMEHYGLDGFEWQDYLAEEKAAMGMPFPEGINVSLNGAYLDFGGLEPMAVNGRTLVPFRALLEGMGAQVDYAGGLITAKTEAGDTLTMELGSSTLYGENGPDSASLSLDVATLQSKDGVSAELTLGVDLGELEDTVFSTLPPEALELIHDADGDRMRLILNTRDGTAYVQGGGVFRLTSEMDGDQWLGGQMGDAQWVMLRQLLGGSRTVTVGSLLVQQQKDSSWYYQSPWEDVMDAVLSLQLFLGDENFTRRQSGGAVTYTARVDLLTLKDRLDELGMDYGEVGLADLLTGQAQLPEIKMDLTARVTGGKLQTMDWTGEISAPGIIPTDVTFDLSATPMKSACTLEFRGEYTGKITLEADSALSVTTRAVPSAPPEGAEILWD